MLYKFELIKSTGESVIIEGRVADSTIYVKVNGDEEIVSIPIPDDEPDNIEVSVSTTFLDTVGAFIAVQMGLPHTFLTEASDFYHNAFEDQNQPIESEPETTSKIRKGRNSREDLN